MVTSLSETQRDELENWQMKKLDGACTLPDSDWRESRSIVSFLLDLGNVTRMEGSVLIFMIPQKSLSVLSSWMVYVLLPTANWHIRFFIYGVQQIEYGLMHLLICLKSEFHWFFYAGYSRENARLCPIVYRDARNLEQKLWAKSKDNNFLHGCPIVSRCMSRPSKFRTEALSKIEWK